MVNDKLTMGIGMFKLFGSKEKTTEDREELSLYERERRKLPNDLKIFFSHNYEKDDRVVAEIVDRVRRFASLQEDSDHTVYKDGRFTGPRGGDLPDLLLKRKIADRIRSSHIIMCPNSRTISDNDWINWEIEIGAIGFRKPVLFVDTSLNTIRNAGLLSKLQAAGLKAERCGNNGEDIKTAINSLCKNDPVRAPSNTH